MLRRLVTLPALALLLLPAHAAAQTDKSDASDAPPAHVAIADGFVSLERDGHVDNAPLNLPLLSGDRLRTTDGRLEIAFADGSTLLLDAQTTVDVQSDSLLRLMDGRIRLVLPGASRAIVYRIDSPAGFARISEAGDYRLALLRSATDTQLELDVTRGAADLHTEQGSTPVAAGERAFASDGLLPSLPYEFNSATSDEFDRWAESLRDAETASGPSGQYLPADMQTYAGTLDTEGDWRYAQPYGYVWYPRVAPDWRPYFYGRWVSYPGYGWTWVGADRFAWPTHHYGRWAVSAGSWFWIPDSHWAPAYVSWAYAPGYVSWCPLGIDDRPAIGIDVVYRPGRRMGWTVLAEPSFGRGLVQEHVVAVERLTDVRRPVFEVRNTAPASRAVERVAAPIHSAGSPVRRTQERNTAARPYAPVTSPRPSAGPATGIEGRPDPITMPFGADHRTVDPIANSPRRTDPISMPFGVPPKPVKPATAAQPGPAQPTRAEQEQAAAEQKKKQADAAKKDKDSAKKPAPKQSGGHG